jgi:4-diphosphocytidyl-2-C-methyl-D-erythritol kinase
MDEYLQLLTIERGDRHIRLRSPAKINLFLEPLRKRPDGYHEIVTVMQTIDLCDEVAIELCGGADAGSEGIVVECEHPDVPAGPENLVWRAARAFSDEKAVESGIRVRLMKRIPVGAGLGGGSSDAAITLLGLNELAGRPLSRRRLVRLGVGLGSDVPFFLYGGTALCRGRGERVRVLKAAPPFWVVLVMPPISVSTAAVYERLNLRLTNRHYVRRMLRSINGSDVQELFRSLYNGLAETVFAGHPSLGSLWKEVVGEGLPYPQLSGSGSTLYGVCCTEAEAAEVSLRLQRRLTGDVFVAVAMNRLAPAKENDRWKSPKSGSA